MTIDPRWCIFLSLALAIMQFLGTASAQLVDAGIDPVSVKHMLAWFSIFAGVGNLVVAALAGIPSKDNTTGMLTNTLLGKKP
jgi:hypothetical protein